MARRNKKVNRKERKIGEEGKIFKIIFSGLALILLISLTEGFGPAFTHMIAHLQDDLKEWAIHLYILGWILVIYGFYQLRKPF